MGIADELAMAKQGRKEGKPVMDSPEFMNEGLPQGRADEGEEKAEAQASGEQAGEVGPQHGSNMAGPEDQGEVSKEAEVASGKEANAEEMIEMPDGTKFATKEEAIAHAKKVVMESQIQKAYDEGQRSLLKQVEDPEMTEEERMAQLEAKMYEDPKKFLEEFEQNIVNKMNETLQQREAKVEAQQRQAQAWEKFNSDNPDLANSQDLVKLVLENNPEVANMTDMEAGMRKLAELTRVKRAQLIDASKPRTVMPNTTAEAIGVSNGPIASTQKVEEKPIDFVTQLRNARKRHA